MSFEDNLLNSDENTLQEILEQLSIEMRKAQKTFLEDLKDNQDNREDAMKKLINTMIDRSIVNAYYQAVIYGPKVNQEMGLPIIEVTHRTFYNILFSDVHQVLRTHLLFKKITTNEAKVMYGILYTRAKETSSKIFPGKEKECEHTIEELVQHMGISDFLKEN